MSVMSGTSNVSFPETRPTEPATAPRTPESSAPRALRRPLSSPARRTRSASGPGADAADPTGPARCSLDSDGASGNFGTGKLCVAGALRGSTPGPRTSTSIDPTRKTTAAAPLQPTSVPAGSARPTASRKTNSLWEGSAARQVPASILATVACAAADEGHSRPQSATPQGSMASRTMGRPIKRRSIDVCSRRPVAPLIVASISVRDPVRLLGARTSLLPP